MWAQNDDGTAQIQRGLLAVTNFQRYFSGHYRVVYSRRLGQSLENSGMSARGQCAVSFLKLF